MRQRLNRYRPRPGGPEIYWRRRAIALAVGMAVFGLIAWAVNGTLGGSASSQTAASARASGGPRAGTGTAAAGTTATSAVIPGPAASGQPSPGTGASQGSPGSGQRPASPATCPAADVVLSLRQRRAAYGRGTWPFFTAEVISTDAQPCTFSTGARSVSVVVRASRSALWDSADCVAGTGAKATVLTRGVPVALSFRWDRRTASPGCHGGRRTVRPGTYLATAVSGSLASNSLSFVLHGAGAAVP